MAIADEPLCLLGRTELRVREAERPHAGVDQRIALRRSPADRVVLHQDDPGAGARVTQPHLVPDVLCRLLAVDGRHGVHIQVVGSQRLGQVMPPKASIDEELRRLLA